MRETKVKMCKTLQKRRKNMPQYIVLRYYSDGSGKPKLVFPATDVGLVETINTLCQGDMLQVYKIFTDHDRTTVELIYNND